MRMIVLAVGVMLMAAGAWWTYRIAARFPQPKPDASLGFDLNTTTIGGIHYTEVIPRKRPPTIQETLEWLGKATPGLALFAFGVIWIVRANKAQPPGRES